MQHHQSHLRLGAMLLLVALSAAGCNVGRQGDVPESPWAENTTESPAVTASAPTHRVVAHNDPPVVFHITDAAKARLREIFATEPANARLLVSWVPDAKSCVGFRYSLDIQVNPSLEEYVLHESNGVKLAMQRDDITFYHGYKLDYYSSPTKTGFLFVAPPKEKARPSALPDVKKSAAPDKSMETKGASKD